MVKEKRSTKKKVKIAAVVLLVLLIYPAVTYVRALTCPGAATFVARTSDWARQWVPGRWSTSPRTDAEQ